MWTGVARFILRNRILLIVLIALFTAFMAYMGRNVKMSYEYARLLPEDDINYVNHQKFKKLFGEEANIFVVGFQDSSFFEVQKFNDLLKLTRDVKKINGVKEAVSVAQLVYLQKDTEKKRFNVQHIFPDTITSQKQLDSLIKVVDQYPLFKNVFFNDTSKVFLVAISVSKEVLNDKSRIDLIRSVKENVDEFGKAHNLQIKYSGLPYIRTEITRKIKSELNIFLILAALVSIIMLYIFFRSFKAVLFSMIVVAVAVSWVMGTMGILHYKVTILTGMIPPLLIVIGIPNSIFLLNKYFAEFKKHGNKIKALQRVIQKTGSAIFLTNLTTASGFATFIITNSDILKEFGIVATINIMALFILSLIIIPISYSFLKPPKEKHTKHLDGKFVNVIVNFLIESAQNRRKQVYALTFIFVLIGIFGATNCVNRNFWCYKNKEYRVYG